MESSGLANTSIGAGPRTDTERWTAKEAQILSHKADPTHSRRTVRLESVGSTFGAYFRTRLMVHSFSQM